MQKYTICLDENLSEELQSMFPKRRKQWPWCILSYEIEEDVVYKSEIGEDIPLLADRLTVIDNLITEKSQGNIIVTHEEAKGIINYYEEQNPDKII